MKVAPQELHWLAGLLEGEGSFMLGPPSSPHQPKIALQMTDIDVVERVARLWHVSVFEINRDRNKSKGWKSYYMCHIRGAGAVKWMKILQPLVGERRQEQIRKALTCYENKSLAKLNPNKIRKIRALLRKEVSQTTIARRFKVTQPMISRIKTGKNYAGV